MNWERDDSHTQRVRSMFTGMGHPNVASVEAHTSDLGHLAILARAPCGGGATDPMRWHISCRGPGRPPHWNELVDCAHHLRPGAVFVVGIPPRSWWLNAHPDVLHVWETGDLALIREFQVNARGDRPT